MSEENYNMAGIIVENGKRRAPHYVLLAGRALHLLREKQVEYPLRRYLDKPEDVIKSYENIVHFTTKWENKDFSEHLIEEKSFMLQMHAYFNPPNRAKFAHLGEFPRFISFPSNYDLYLQTDWIDDYFIEESRLRCSRPQKGASPHDEWYNYGDQVNDALQLIFAKNPHLAPEELVQSLQDHEPNNCRLMREALYKVGRNNACSHERASFVMMIFKLLGGDNPRIFDACAGWGDKMIAAIALGAELYLGIDPNEYSQPGFINIVETLGGHSYPQLSKEQLHRRFAILPLSMPDCELPPEAAPGTFDIGCCSPPSYDTEIYSPHKGQSVMLFPDKRQWFLGFMFPTLDRLWSLIKPGGYMIIQSVIIAEIAPYIEAFLPGSVYCGPIAIELTIRFKPMWTWYKLAPGEQMPPSHADYQAYRVNHSHRILQGVFPTLYPEGLPRLPELVIPPLLNLGVDKIPKQHKKFTYIRKFTKEGGDDNQKAVNYHQLEYTDEYNDMNKTNDELAMYKYEDRQSYKYAKETLELLKSKNIGYPLVKNYFSVDSVLSSFRNIVNYKPQWDDRIYIKYMHGLLSSFKVQMSARFEPPFPSRFSQFRFPRFMSIRYSYDEYLERDWVIDYFTEEARLKCTRSSQVASPYDKWYQYGEDTFAALKHLFSNSENLTPAEVIDGLKDADPHINSLVRDALYITNIGGTCAQQKASFLYAIFNLLAPAGEKLRVFDACAGWGGSITAAIAAKCELFVGIDPNMNIQEGIPKLVETFGKEMFPELSAEQLHRRFAILPLSMPDCELPPEAAPGTFDIGYISPPSFNTEVYSTHEGQSIFRHPDRKEWVLKFLFPTIAKVWSLIKPGGYILVQSIIINEIIPYIEAFFEDALYCGPIAAELPSRYRALWTWYKLAPGERVPQNMLDDRKYRINKSHSVIYENYPELYTEGAPKLEKFKTPAPFVPFPWETEIVKHNPKFITKSKFITKPKFITKSKNWRNDISRRRKMQGGDSNIEIPKDWEPEYKPDDNAISGNYYEGAIEEQLEKLSEMSAGELVEAISGGEITVFGGIQKSYIPRNKSASTMEPQLRDLFAHLNREKLSEHKSFSKERRTPKLEGKHRYNSKSKNVNKNRSKYRSKTIHGGVQKFSDIEDDTIGEESTNEYESYFDDDEKKDEKEETRHDEIIMDDYNILDNLVN